MSIIKQIVEEILSGAKRRVDMPREGKVDHEAEYKRHTRLVDKYWDSLPHLAFRHEDKALRHAELHQKLTGKPLYDPEYKGPRMNAITKIKEETLGEASLPVLPIGYGSRVIKKGLFKTKIGTATHRFTNFSGGERRLVKWDDGSETDEHHSKLRALHSVEDGYWDNKGKPPKHLQKEEESLGESFKAQAETHLGQAAFTKNKSDRNFHIMRHHQLMAKHHEENDDPLAAAAEHRRATELNANSYGLREQADISADKLYDIAQKHLAKAKVIEAKPNKKANWHHHMSNYHEHLGQWHDHEGRHGAADRSYAKVEFHDDAFRTSLTDTKYKGTK